MSEHDKWLCDEWRCGWVGTSKEYLSAPDPFNEGCTLVACPECREVGTLIACCDAEGCKKPAGCGTPTKNGYRQTCYEHIPKEEA